MNDNYSGPAVSQANGYESPSVEEIQAAILDCQNAAAGVKNSKLREGANIAQDGEVPEWLWYSASDFAWMEDYFKPLYDRDPEDAVALREALPPAQTAIRTDQVHQVGANNGIFLAWEGDMAEDFRTYFLNPFPNAVDHQSAVVDELISAVACYEAVLRNARTDAKTIAEKTKEIFDGLNDTEHLSWKMTLELTAAVLGVAGAIPSPAGKLDFAGKLGLIAQGVTVAQMALNTTIQGGSVEEVEESLKAAIDKAVEAMTYEEEQVAKALEHSIATVEKTLAGRPEGSKRVDPRTTSTLLPHEPTGDGVPNLTNGRKPTPEDMWPR